MGKIILAHISILFARDLNFCDSQKDGLNKRFLIDLSLENLFIFHSFVQTDSKSNKLC